MSYSPASVLFAQQIFNHFITSCIQMQANLVYNPTNQTGPEFLSIFANQTLLRVFAVSYCVRIMQLIIMLF